jgi:hypothetical protein
LAGFERQMDADPEIPILKQAKADTLAVRP